MAQSNMEMVPLFARDSRRLSAPVPCAETDLQPQSTDREALMPTPLHLSAEPLDRRDGLIRGAL
jgi:hypothetical protein